MAEVVVIRPDGSRSHLQVPGSASLRVTGDGALVVLGTDPGGVDLGVHLAVAGTWFRARIGADLPRCPRARVSAPLPEP
ncbi:hypothetical protein GCM10023162_32430 [Klenkia terrae]